MKGFVSQKRARGFQVEIYFTGLRGRVRLGIVTIYAETEEEALEHARACTSYGIVAADKSPWLVRESAAGYAKITP